MLGSTTTQIDPHENLNVIEDRNFDQDYVKSYIKGSFLGKGGFARCYELISEETKEVEAVKIIQKSSLVKKRSLEKLSSEIKIHQSLNHRNIVQFRRHFDDHLNVYIVLEICSNKTLNDLLKRKRRLSESEIKFYLLQVLHALEYLHGKRIIHRDLKLGNLFLNENMEIKMGDFGLATKLEYLGQKRKTICGTPNYIAPEILESRGHGCQVDIWSFGVICYTLAYGRPPFQSKDVKETYRKIKAGSFSYPDSVNFSTNFKQVINSCLQKQPHKRPTSSELKKMDFFFGVSLSRQPSVSFRAQASVSITKEDKDLSRSDNGKMYTNNQLITSKDTGRQKSQDKFLATDRSATSLRKNISTNLRRANSQRILKETNQQHQHQQICSGSILQQNSNSNNNTLKKNSQNHNHNHQQQQQQQQHQQHNNLHKNMNKSPRKTYQQLDTCSQLNFKQNSSISSVLNLNMKEKEKEKEKGQIFVSVKKWIDYSSKYGIGYSLTNGSCGVYFNDSSKMLALNDEYFLYIEKVAKEDVSQKYLFSDYPVELKKKVSLFGHFKGYLYGQSQNTPTLSTTPPTTTTTILQKEQIYIRRWYRAKHAVIFRLSNKSVQVIFIDQSEILISSSKKKVIYTNKQKEKSEYWLNQILQSQNRELIKRFQYTKEVLNEMAVQHDKNK